VKIILIGGFTLLIQLIIDNFAIIKKVDIDFKNGMNSITGETGAGKSIILTE
jgi:DNA repair protein RecN (Recombination protein N)